MSGGKYILVNYGVNVASGDEWEIIFETENKKEILEKYTKELNSILNLTNDNEIYEITNVPKWVAENVKEVNYNNEKEIEIVTGIYIIYDEEGNGSIIAVLLVK